MRSSTVDALRGAELFVHNEEQRFMYIMRSSTVRRRGVALLVHNEEQHCSYIKKSNRYLYIIRSRTLRT